MGKKFKIEGILIVEIRHNEICHSVIHDER